MSGNDVNRWETADPAPEAPETETVSEASGEEPTAEEGSVSAVQSFVEDITSQPDPETADPPTEGAAAPEATTEVVEVPAQQATSESEANDEPNEQIEENPADEVTDAVPDAEPASEAPAIAASAPEDKQNLEQEAAAEEAAKLDELVLENQRQEEEELVAPGSVPDQEPEGDTMSLVLPEQMTAAQISADHRLYEPTSLA